MKRALIMSRVSSTMQVKSSESLDAHADLCEEACTANDWAITGVVMLDAETAYAGVAEEGRRPRFWATIRQIERGEVVIDYLVVWELTRFIRDTEVMLNVRRRLLAVGVRIYEVSQGEFLDNPEREMLTVMRAQLGADESRRHGNRVRVLKEYGRRKGRFIGLVPFGYTRADPRSPATVVESEAKAIVDGHIAFARGASLRSIAQEWNRRGLVPRSRHGNVVFEESAVRAILGCRTYLGELRRETADAQGRTTTTWLPGQHPPIVTEAMIADVESRRASRSGMAIGRVGGRPALLSGLLHCGLCDKRLEVNRGGAGLRDRTYYRHRARTDAGCEASRGTAPGLEFGARRRGAMNWPAEVIDGPIERMVRVMVVDQSWLDGVQRSARSTRTVAAREAQSRSDAGLRAARRLLVTGEIDEAEYQELRAAALASRPAMAVEPEAVRFGARRFEGWASLWSEMGDDLRNAALRELVRGVWVGLDGGIEVEPLEECEELFAARSQHVGRWASGGIRSTTHQQRYAVDELIRDVA